jgi:N-acetylneuraminic acid mutarotase
VRKTTKLFTTFLGSGVFSLLAFALLLGFSSRAQAAALTWQTLTPVPTARYGAATGVIGGKLYVASGCCVYNSPPYPRFTENEAYDPIANTWTTKAPIPLAVYGAATGVINGKLYVAGGAADENNGTNRADLQVYDPVADSWTTKPPLPVVGVLPQQV